MARKNKGRRRGQPHALPAKVAAEPSQKRSRPYGSHFGGVAQGGITNTTTGMGTSLDKTEGSFFTPTRFYWQGPLEILGVQSWAARNFIDLPVEDQFIKWRLFIGDDASAAEAMEKAETKHLVVPTWTKELSADRGRLRNIRSMSLSC